MSTTGEPTFAQRAQQMIDTAQPGESIVVGACEGGSLILLTRPTSGDGLARLGRAVLEHALEQLQRERGKSARTLAQQVMLALECLPDPNFDADDEGSE